MNFTDKCRYEPSYYYHAFSFPKLAVVCTGFQTIQFLSLNGVSSLTGLKAIFINVQKVS